MEHILFFTFKIKDSIQVLINLYIYHILLKIMMYLIQFKHFYLLVNAKKQTMNIINF